MIRQILLDAIEGLPKFIVQTIAHLIRLAIDALLVYFLWNVLVEDGLSIVAVTYGQAFLMCIIAAILFDQPRTTSRAS